MKYDELFSTSFDTQVFRKSLAKLIGLNEAIILNQLHYWVEKNRKAHKNCFDNKYWVYNTYEDWQKNDFEWWSIDTIRRSFNKLEKSGLVLVDNFNKLAMDRTKWYTIDYEKLEKMLTNNEKSPICANCHDGKLQNAIMQNSNLLSAIPENTTENITENTEKHSPTEFNTDTFDESVRIADFKWVITRTQIVAIMSTLGYLENSTETQKAIQVVRYYFDYYLATVGKTHPPLNRKAMTTVLQNFLKGTERIPKCDLDTHLCLIYEHFESDYNKDIDYHIQHFMTDGIRNHLDLRLQ